MIYDARGERLGGSSKPKQTQKKRSTKPRGEKQNKEWDAIFESTVGLRCVASRPLLDPFVSSRLVLGCAMEVCVCSEFGLEVPNPNSTPKTKTQLQRPCCAQFRILLFKGRIINGGGEGDVGVEFGLGVADE